MSNLTIEEWATAYELRFGRDHISVNAYVEGEAEFFEQMRKDVGDYDAPGHMAIILLRRTHEQANS